MAKPVLVLLTAAVCAQWLLGCASQPQVDDPSDLSSRPGEDIPISSFQTFGGITLGEPVGVARDFDGNILVADRAPGQVVHLLLASGQAVEFDQPPLGAGFSPADLKSSGFFVYVVGCISSECTPIHSAGGSVGQ